MFRDIISADIFGIPRKIQFAPALCTDGGMRFCFSVGKLKIPIF